MINRRIPRGTACLFLPCCADQSAFRMGFGEAQRQSRHCRPAAGGAGHCPVAACQSSPHSPNRAGFGEIRLSLKVYYVDQSAFRVGAQVEVGNADPQSATRIRRIRELQSMVPEFVAGTGGSKWLSALPTGSRWGRALPGQKGGLSIVPSLPDPRRIRGDSFLLPSLLHGSMCFPDGVWGGAFLRKAASPTFP